MRCPLFAAGVGVGVRAQQGPAPPLATLPRPLARFDSAAGWQFLPPGRGVEKIVGVDSHRHTVIFDTPYVKWDGHGNTWAEAGGRLYHLGCPGPDYQEQECLDFEVLTYDSHRDDWFWNHLPSPPFGSYYTLEPIESFADADAGAASTIRISTRNDGTYDAFDVASASWRKEGDWALSFGGHAQYVADYVLWFGFTGGGESDLCAADLNVAGMPACRHVWANVNGHADRGSSWWSKYSYLSYLGSGRFCVTRFFVEMYKDGRHSMTPVVTAVEATCAAASAMATEETRMVRRASVLYHSPEWHSPCWAY